MQDKMTGEFASAMVTVIPVVLLLAAVEFNNINQTHMKRRERYLQALRDLVEASSGGDGGHVSLERPNRISTFLTFYWYAVLSTHIAAEIYLIGWLSGTERAAHPLAARLVAAVGTFGFTAVIVGAISVREMAMREFEREESALKARREEQLRQQAGNDASQSADAAPPCSTP